MLRRQGVSAIEWHSNGMLAKVTLGAPPALATVTEESASLETPEEQEARLVSLLFAAV